MPQAPTRRCRPPPGSSSSTADQRAADGDAGAVERVDEPRALALGRPVARVHPPRLEVAADRAGGDLAVAVLPRQPDLDVEGLAAWQSPCRRCRASSRDSGQRASFCSTASAQPSMRSCSALDCSGVVIETSSTFVNWLLADHAARVAPRRARLGAEAWRGRGEAQRAGLASSRMSSRTRLVSETSAVGISHRSRPPSSLPSLRRQELVTRETSAAAPCRTSPRRGRAAAGSPRYSRARPVCRSSINCESARSSRAIGPLFTTNRAPEIFVAVSKSIRPRPCADREMLLRLETHPWLLAPVAEDHVVVLVLALGHVVRRNVGDRGERRVELSATASPPRLRLHAHRAVRP